MTKTEEGRASTISRMKFVVDKQLLLNVYVRFSESWLPWFEKHISEHNKPKEQEQIDQSETGWWFDVFFMFTLTWGNDPILICFKWVEDTN